MLDEKEDKEDIEIRGEDESFAPESCFESFWQCENEFVKSGLEGMERGDEEVEVAAEPIDDETSEDEGEDEDACISSGEEEKEEEDEGKQLELLGSVECCSCPITSFLPLSAIS